MIFIVQKSNFATIGILFIVVAALRDYNSLLLLASLRVLCVCCSSYSQSKEYAELLQSHMVWFFLCLANTKKMISWVLRAKAGANDHKKKVTITRDSQAIDIFVVS